MDRNRTYTVKQVARLLGFSTNTVYKYLNEGKIKATRLGASGRFRIPEEEVDRLVGEKEENRPILPSQVQESAKSLNPKEPQVIPQNAISQDSRQDNQGFLDRRNQILSEEKDIYSPGLFDWFISTLAIFLGLSFFLFPEYVHKVNFEPYSVFHLSIKILLIAFGLILMGADIFAHKRKFLRSFITLVIGILFISLAIPALLLNNYMNALGSLSIGILLVFSFFTKPNDFVKFFFMILLIAGVTGSLFIYDPSYFPNQSISFWIYGNKLLFGSLWFCLFSLVLIGGIYGYLKNKILLHLSFLFSAAAALVYASFATSGARWEQGIYAIIFGSFALIFPAARRFENLAKYSKKELIQSFVWFAIVLAAGVILVIFVQQSFLNFSASENQRAIETAKSTIYSYLTQGQNDVSRFGADQELVSLMKDPEKNFEAIDLLIKKDYENTTTIRRLFTMDKNGKGLTIYPKEADFTGTEFSDRDYFYIAKSAQKLTISDSIKPRIGNAPAAVIVGFPLFDEKDNFLGLLGGSIDFGKLTQKLQEIKFGTNGEFVIADAKGRIVIHSDPKFILTPIETGGALSNAVKGKTGVVQSYDEAGRLALKSYSSLDSYGWGIKAQQPLSDIVKSSSRVSFLIFLIAISLGIGSLMSALYLRRR